MRNVFVGCVALAASAWVQAADVSDFFGVMGCSVDNRRFIGVQLTDTISDAAGRTTSKPGRVALEWNGGKAIKVNWGRPEVQGDGAVKLSFDGRAPVVLKLLRPVPVEDNDYKPFFTLKEEGGKAYRCGFEAE